MLSLFSSLHGALVFSMLSFVLSRSFCQAVAEVSRSAPTVGSLIRTVTTPRPASRETPDNASVVTYSQLKTMLSNRDIQLFDVRNPDEYKVGHIPYSVNIPLGTLEESLKLSSQRFELKFHVRAPGKDDNNIVFYCRSGNRSHTALIIARQLGFRRVRHYKGGYSEWAEKEGK
ncbi:thiosulfate:glutathione sulfurtransferase [Cheilinus undulatus]|uniref:thiosulfate:glutathione sulfurtransferase n=1 Tax=Cheilinus undulatus TaxID=241271 RepID=UPI001BD559E5|nr:thiosulfate:glutathione sulfurtransferase [Cheilinus undulatus]